ncbi:hemophore-related protein [Mycolicibacterium sp. P1-5]|uniref:hemophore-related protein n=1 Tax=Mycolicibacterium sp. P1-5 TaxID=2024617 RepID=UPI0011ED605E|nr:hemophore-related protein [Mycolicibacterium sp. P1-5]KAA0109336.1 hemophore-related protein [Mycolicibacterium sp. P1-5]
MLVRRAVLTILAAGAACALTIPNASAEPAPTPAPTSDCSAAGLSATISSVTKNLSDYFAVHPDANQALLDATRQSAFGAVGAFNTYFNDHPDQANDIRAIKAPLNDFQNRCGLQVEPAEALVVIGEL